MNRKTRRAYADPVYLAARAAMLATGPVCHECKVRPARVADHVPALSEHQHVVGGGCGCVLLPHCWQCSSSQGGRIRARRLDEELGRMAAQEQPDEQVLEPAGFAADDRAWDVPWLDDLRDVPGNATWPRLMTPPHPEAVGSLGDDFAVFAADRMQGELRWWQRLAATRLLEVDVDGRLVWPAALVLTARQVGKSTLLRELAIWRLLQAERYGEPQLVVHVATNRAIAAEIQRGARAWARERPDLFPRTMSANGYETIEHASGSRWLIKSRAATYGHSSSLALVDEGWGIPAAEVEDAIVPTLAETAAAQLLITSTANRSATSLVLGRRRAALELLDDPGAGDLLVEWSAPPGCDIRDRAMWRMASPYWSEQREQLIAAAAERALAGDTEDGDDPQAAVRGQWLNQWIEGQRRDDRRGEPLFAQGVWDRLSTDENCRHGRFTVAIEDFYGQGAAVAAVGELEDGTWLLAGWEFSSRAEAVAKVAELLADLAPRVDLVAGASLLGDPDLATLPGRAAGATTATTRQALPLLRELAAQGRVRWDPTDGLELAAAVSRCRVVERQTGLVAAGPDRTDLVRASAWALLHQVERRPAPMVH